MADIPGIDEPMDRVLLAQTHSKPQWPRIEWAEQLLVHAYTHSATTHSAPTLTAIAFTNLRKLPDGSQMPTIAVGGRPTPTS